LKSKKVKRNNKTHTGRKEGKKPPENLRRRRRKCRVPRILGECE